MYYLNIPKSTLYYRGVAILSRLPLVELELGSGRARFLTAAVELGGQQLHLTCCHLNHWSEPNRLRELKQMETKVPANNIQCRITFL